MIYTKNNRKNCKFKGVSNNPKKYKEARRIKRLTNQLHKRRKAILKNDKYI